MTIKEANELKEGCRKLIQYDTGEYDWDDELDMKVPVIENDLCGANGKYCPECKAKAKANLEKLGCVRYNKSKGINGNLCPKCQEEKGIYEEITK